MIFLGLRIYQNKNIFSQRGSLQILLVIFVFLIVYVLVKWTFVFIINRANINEVTTISFPN